MDTWFDSVYGVWNSSNVQSDGEVHTRMATKEELAELDAKLGAVKRASVTKPKKHVKKKEECGSE